MVSAENFIIGASLQERVKADICEATKVEKQLHKMKIMNLKGETRYMYRSQGKRLTAWLSRIQCCLYPNTEKLGTAFILLLSYARMLTVGLGGASWL